MRDVCGFNILPVLVSSGRAQRAHGLILDSDWVIAYTGSIARLYTLGGAPPRRHRVFWECLSTRGEAGFFAGYWRGLVDRLLGTDPGLSWIWSEQLMGVEAFLAHHHAGDVGPPPAWGGIADDGPDAPCAVAGMFGCAPMNSTYDYWKNGVPWEGPPVVFH